MMRKDRILIYIIRVLLSIVTCGLYPFVVFVLSIMDAIDNSSIL